jgi:hypothetical protein
MRLKIILGSALAVAILVVAGCGGGGGDTSGGTNGSTSANGGSTAATTANTGSGESSGSSRSLTKKEFIAKGDEICAQVPTSYQRLKQALEEENIAKKKPEPTTAERNLKAAVPPVKVAAKELEELVPPTGDEQAAEEIVSALEAAAAGLEEKPSSPLSGPESPYAAFQKLTKEYGFKTCNLL